MSPRDLFELAVILGAALGFPAGVLAGMAYERFRWRKANTRAGAG